MTLETTCTSPTAARDLRVQRGQTAPQNAGRGGRARGGFTLVELLCALLILTLATGLVATGVATALNVQAAERFESQSQILADTIEEALTDTFRSMREGSGSETLSVTIGGTSVEIPSTSQALMTGTGEAAQAAADIPAGALYLASQSGPVKVLNGSAYDGCTVSVSNWACSLDSVSWDSTVTSADGSRTSGTYHFYFRPLASDGMWKGTSATPGSQEDDTGTDDTVDEYNKLLRAIQSARNIKQNNKTAQAFQTLQNAIAAAQQVADDSSATATQLAEATETLKAAIRTFNASTSTSTEVLDTATLDDLIGSAAAIEKGKKTDEAFRKLQSVIAAAQQVSSNADIKSTTQDAIDAALEALYAAIDEFYDSPDASKEYSVADDPEAPAAGSGIDDDLKDLRQWTDDVRKAVSWNLDTTSDGVMVLLAEPSWNKSIITMLYYNGHYYVPYIIYNHGQSWESSQEVQWYYTSIPYTLENVTSGEAYESNGNWYKWVQVL